MRYYLCCMQQNTSQSPHQSPRSRDLTWDNEFFAPSKEFQSHTPPIPVNPAVIDAPTQFQLHSHLPFDLGALLGSAR